MQEWEPYRPSFSDRELGMDRRISRRDFLDGVAVMAVAAGLGGCSADKVARNASNNDQNGPPAGGFGDVGVGNPAYPPAMTGLRGSTNKALHVPHQLRDGSYWSGHKEIIDTKETYDLVVVGAGISGLSAAYFYRQKHPTAKILILDNHDDFGGHARRNEFTPDGKLIISYGGSQSIEGPSVWSKTALGLLTSLGVDLKKFEKYYDQDFNTRWKLTDSEFFNKETFGRDHLAKMTEDSVPTSAGLANAPIAVQAKNDILTMYNKPGDYLPGLTDAQKKNQLVAISYKQFLTGVAKYHPDVARYMQTFTSDEWGYGIDAFGALDAWACEYPGFDGLKLNRDKPDPRCIKTVQIQWDEDDPYIYHFPEGNNALCKLMIGRLIPGTGAPATMDADPLSKIDYSKLDVAANDVKVRLNSPVVNVQHVNSDPATGRVIVKYQDGDGKVRSVEAGGAVMACYATMIPFIVPELTGDQKQGLEYGIKLPIIYAMVQIKNWKAWQKLGIYHTRFTGPYWCVAELDYPVSMGGYEFSKDPEQPIVVHMIRMATREGENPRGGIVEGRRDLYQTPFSYYERTIRDQLARLLGPGGFDPANDIQGITINRWGHGYALEYARPWASFWPEGPLPNRIGSKPYGRITIANSDSEARAYADAAIDAAARAVNQLGA
ncbi:NAD(P)/FAD-dependent oxidoreductase [Actinocorallia lasiicapitis]